MLSASTGSHWPEAAITFSSLRVAREICTSPCMCVRGRNAQLYHEHKCFQNALISTLESYRLNNLHKVLSCIAEFSEKLFHCKETVKNERYDEDTRARQFVTHF